MDQDFEEGIDDALLDLEHKSNDELRDLLGQLSAEEQHISYRRRVLHGRIDILRAELVRRLKVQREAGGDVISGNDIEKLITILANDLRAAAIEPSDDELAPEDDDDEII